MSAIVLSFLLWSTSEMDNLVISKVLQIIFGEIIIDEIVSFNDMCKHLSYQDAQLETGTQPG